MKMLRQSILFFSLLTLLVGGIYPAMVYGISKILFHDKASGGIVIHNEQKVGAELIGQDFSKDEFFWGRPSAVSYNASASSGSNYSLTNRDHQRAIHERKARGLDYDLLTTSASGLDPHITPTAAFLQVKRVATARGLNPETLKKLVGGNVEGRQLGFLGEERVNVLRLNIALERLMNE